MKKSLLALAALSMIAGSVLAQTSVTVYGIIDAGLVSDTNGTAVGHAMKLESGNEAGTRFGFRGTESLGDGLAANFKLEGGVGIDTGASTQGGLLFGRQASVGLSGGFGAVNLGRVNTPSFNAMIAIDPLVTGFYGQMNNVFAAGGLRMNNTINYFTPVLNGLSGEAAYGFGEVAGSAAASRVYAFGVAYQNGPVVVRLAQHNANDATGTIGTRNTMLGSVYDFGLVKLRAAYAVNKNDATLDTRDALIGFTLPMGVNTVMGSLIRKSDRRFANSDLNQATLAYLYALSRRTDLYAAYTRSANDSAVKYNAAALGATAKVAQVGIRHNF